MSFDLSLIVELGKQEHHDQAPEVMRKSVVLLKNSLATCRYPKKSHSILIASGADDIGSQYGG